MTPGGAAAVLALYALTYFVPFYLWRATRPSPALSRDAPSVIRARIRSVSLSCAVCLAATYAVLSRGAGAGAAPAEVLRRMGLWPPAPADALRALLLTALLFAGPLFSYFVVDRGWADWLRLAPLKEVWTEWTEWRNIVAVCAPSPNPTHPYIPSSIPLTLQLTNHPPPLPPPLVQGPITEELLFRSASVPLMLAARAPLAQTVFLSPVIFGLAHVHHFYEFRLSHPGVPASRALLRSAFQLGYTTLFGAYATFVFVRTGSLAAVCAVHAFCNCMGLPQVWGRVEPAWSARPSVLWTAAYYLLLVAGAVLWWKNLWVLTESDNALVASDEFW